MSAGAVEAAQRLAAIVESTDDAIVSKDLAGTIQSWNRAAERIFGYTAEEAIGKPITIVIPEELKDEEPDILRRIAAGERVDRFETIRQRKDGSKFPVSLTISPIRDREGAIVGASKIARDISDLSRIQERQEMLLREMNHRIKNLFAVASAVVALSARSAAPAELASAIQSRLAALARAHELILPPSAGASLSLADLVQTVLAPYDSVERPIRIEGPALECGSTASTSFALLLHEFATNSVKHGAFGHPDGRVAVTWTVNAGILDLTWSEEGSGGFAEGDRASGFGTFLIEATVRIISATIRRSWSRQGLKIDIRIPLDKLR
ncbi:MAG: PAS domain S-box protein [Parvibaculaceae bacterium]